MTSLPDDVSIRTSGNFGRHIGAMSAILSEWLPPIPEEALKAHDAGLSYTPSPRTVIDNIQLDVYEQLQACRFNTLTGYYWIAIACLRGAIELSVIGAYFETSRSKSEFDDWYAGGEEVKFGKACDLLPKVTRFCDFERKLKNQLSLNVAIFDQRTDSHRGGWARSLYDTLSDVVHTRPHVAAGHYWDGSNGPIFVEESFLECYRYFLEIALLCRIIMTLAKPSLRYPPGFEVCLSAPDFVAPEYATSAFKLFWNKP
ncbi:MAG TPA: hypothetical protein V6C81_02165 [Planktothrix sp.]|jgi:hypothetical protein